MLPHFFRSMGRRQQNWRTRLRVRWLRADDRASPCASSAMMFCCPPAQSEVGLRDRPAQCGPGPPNFPFRRRKLVVTGFFESVLQKRVEKINSVASPRHDDKNFVALFDQQTGKLGRFGRQQIDPVTPSTTVFRARSNAYNLPLARFVAFSLLESLPSAIISRSNAGSNSFLPSMICRNLRKSSSIDPLIIV